MLKKFLISRMVLIKVSFPDELVHEKEKFKAISDELDQTFAEMSGYWKLSLTSYLPRFFVYFLYNLRPHHGCHFYLDQHKLQKAKDQTLGSLDTSTSSNFTA